MENKIQKKIYNINNFTVKLLILYITTEFKSEVKFLLHFQF